MVKRYMRYMRSLRTRIMLALLSVFIPLLVVVPSGIASAAESVPLLQWSPPTATGFTQSLVTSPTGSITIPCTTGTTGNDLRTYDATGQLVQDISRTATIDGVTNCIAHPVVDKNGTVYGIPASTSTYVNGPNLLAYANNTLKWKYPLPSPSRTVPLVVGANGNIYAALRESDGYIHIIGIAPEVVAGQTQPATVLDVTTTTDASTMLYAYKDGLVIHGQSSGNARYYSYGGKFLGQATIGLFGSEKLNADGQLFSYNFVSGSYTSLSVSMYDPHTGAVAWTTSASTPGANVHDASVYPLPNGGVVALLKEQKMVQGVPAVPTEYVDSWVTLSAGGTVLASPHQLSNTGTLGTGGPATTYGGTWISVDGSGQLALVRPMTVATGISNPATVPAIGVTLLDAVSGTVSYGQVMSGDLSKSGGPDGYNLMDGPRLANGTIFLEADCQGNCPNSDTAIKVYALKVSSAAIDYPRGAVLAAYPRTSAHSAYVAIGDSFSSGEGNPPFLAGTDIPGVNTCHRSSVAYSEILSGSSAKIPSLGANGFRACSGAIADNLWDVAQWNEGTQLDRFPDTTTTLVTLTIGGNDIGFSDFASACASLNSSCDVGTPAYTNALNHINGDLAAKLTAAYQNILAMAPNAKVYVIGYPQVVANKLVTDPIDTRCPTLSQGTTRYGNARAARYIVGQLDQKISTTVGAVGNTRLHYIPADGSTSPFVGHEVCGTDTTSWFQNIDQIASNKAYVFHPNALGQQGYATLVGPVINAG